MQPHALSIAPSAPALSSQAVPCWQVAACHLGAQPDGPGAQHASVPYVLIQGPPGTGKTHTVKVLPLFRLSAAAPRAVLPAAAGLL